MTTTRIAGPRCRTCDNTEQACALHGGCCPACTHTFGDEEPHRPATPFPHGTERGYERHRKRRTFGCEACRRAHAAHISRKRVAAERAATEEATG